MCIHHSNQQYIVVCGKNDKATPQNYIESKIFSFSPNLAFYKKLLHTAPSVAKYIKLCIIAGSIIIMLISYDNLLFFWLHFFLNIKRLSLVDE